MGTFHGADGESYPATFNDGPDEEGLCTLMIELPVGHPDKPNGGTMLVQVPITSFTPDEP